MISRRTLIYPIWEHIAIAYDPARPVVFMHVPKTSGTALSVGLLEALAAKKVVTGFDGVMFGGFDKFASLSTAVRQTIIDGPSSLPVTADFIHGHFSLSTTLARYPDAQFITILREPRVRLLSLWRYWRVQTSQTMQGWGAWSEVVARSLSPLEEFLSDRVVACQTDNMTLRMLLWPHPMLPASDFIDPQHDAMLLNEAITLISKFDFVDILEGRAFADGLSGWLGRPLCHRKLNETAIDGGMQNLSLYLELTDLAFDRLDALSRLDAVLWKAIARRHTSDDSVCKLSERSMIKATVRYAFSLD